MIRMYTYVKAKGIPLYLLRRKVLLIVSTMNAVFKYFYCRKRGILYCQPLLYFYRKKIIYPNKTHKSNIYCGSMLQRLPEILYRNGRGNRRQLNSFYNLQLYVVIPYSGNEIQWRILLNANMVICWFLKENTFYL